MEAAVERFEMRGLGVHLLLKQQMKESRTWAWSRGGGPPTLHPSQVACVIATSLVVVTWTQRKRSLNRCLTRMC